MDIEEKLLDTFNRVNEWLRYAEQKNTGILAFSAAAFAAIIGFLGSSFKITPEWRTGLFMGAGLLAVACLLAILSFIPKMKIIFKDRGAPADTDNLYFYGHLCKYNGEQLVETMARLYYNNDLNLVTRSNIDIATQIAINSGIAVDKYNIFTVSAWIVLASLLSIIIVPTIIMGAN